MIKLGIDRIDEFIEIFENKRIGLITNQTGVNRDLVSTIDILSEKTNLVALYAPEHGVRGDIQAGKSVQSYKDSRTGIKVYSLYGKNKKPSKEMLEDVDVLVFDIQDIGSRLYTYIYTMAYCMEGAKKYNKEFVILDRPNLLNGIDVEGGLIKEGFTSFVGLYSMPYRHGLTVGELGEFFNKEFDINCKLKIIKMEGWKRDMEFEECMLDFIPPSPNIPNMDTVFAYNSTCIFEGTNISEGRGTTKPFEYVGAPWIDGYKLAIEMNKLNLAGVKFREVFFTPTFSKHVGELCSGIQVIIYDRKIFKPIKTGLHLLYEVKKINEEKFEYLKAYNEKGKPMIDYNTGSDYIRTNNFNPNEIYIQWEKEKEEFLVKREKYKLYD